MLRILDVGSGPVIPQIPSVEVTRCDRRDFGPEVDRQDMEKLTYPDNSFDVVQCINALDHTKDPKSAIEQMIRVCKPEGYIYIDCALIQRTTSGGWHYWDAEADGSFTSKNDSFNLKDFGFEVEFIDNHGEKRYNHIIARRQL